MLADLIVSINGLLCLSISLKVDRSRLVYAELRQVKGNVLQCAPTCIPLSLAIDDIVRQQNTQLVLKTYASCICNSQVSTKKWQGPL